MFWADGRYNSGVKYVLSMFKAWVSPPTHIHRRDRGGGGRDDIVKW